MIYEPSPARTPEQIVERFIAKRGYEHTPADLMLAASHIKTCMAVGGKRAFTVGDIVPNRIFSDGKGNIRKILDLGPQYISVMGQKNRDCCLYTVLKTNGWRSSQRIGRAYKTSRLAMVNWAFNEVSLDQLRKLGVLDYSFEKQRLVTP